MGKIILPSDGFAADQAWLRFPGGVLLQRASGFTARGAPVPPVTTNRTAGWVSSEDCPALCRSNTPLKLTCAFAETLCIAETNDFRWLPPLLFR